MSQQIINTGTGPGAGNGDNLFDAFTKVNQNFTEIYSGNVVAGNAAVTSVAGRTGNVVLNFTDVTGVASQADITGLRSTINAANTASRAYTDAAIASLGGLSNITASGGTLSNIQLAGHSWGTVANLSVVNDLAVSGAITNTAGISTAGSIAIGGDIVLSGTLRFHDSSSMTTVFNPAALEAKISAVAGNLVLTNANVTAANSAIAGLQSSVTGQQTQINALSANAATQQTQITALQSNASAQQTQINTLFANAASQGATLQVLTGNAGALTTRLNSTDANVTAANASISALTLRTGTLESNAAVQETEITSLRANVAAANLAIAGFNNSGIATINANVAAANAQIASLQSASTLANVAISGLTANAGLQGGDLLVLFANAGLQSQAIAAVNNNVSTLSSQINAVSATQTVLSGQIAAVDANAQAKINTINANVAAANLSVSQTNANVAAANVAIVQTQGRISAANAQIALRANIATPTFTGTVTTPSLIVTGNATVGNLQAGSFSVTNFSGTLLTGAQPNITQVGTLGNLTVSGNVQSNWMLANYFRGTIATPNQLNITQVGTLNSLAVAGNATLPNITTSGTVSANSIVAGYTNAGLLTAQTLAVGAVAVAQNITANNITLGNNITVGNVVRSNLLFGTISTPAQPNITQIGTLGSLNVTANATVGNLTTTGTVIAGNVVGTMLTRNQPAIRQVGYLDYLNVAGDTFIAGNLNVGGLNTNLYFNSATANVFVANNIYATQGITGQIKTSVQPYITGLGDLTALNVLSTVYATGYYTAGTTSTNGLVANVAQVGNLTVLSNLTVANVQVQNIFAQNGVQTAGDIRTTGNVFAQIVSTSLGDFQSVNGLINSPAQPNITSVGQLTSLAVAGDANFNGNVFSHRDFYVYGNLYISGNTTTVNSTQIVTRDLNIVLANTAGSAGAAAGSGLLVGTTGQYGNLTVYNGTWQTPNSFAIGGNLSVTGNVSGLNATFNNVTGTLLTASQPNITIIGTLATLTVTGNVLTGNINTSTAKITAIQFADGTLQTTAASGTVTAALVAVNANVVAANAQISQLQSNITAANTSIATNATNISILFANAATQETEIAGLRGNITAANLAIGINTASIATLQSNAATQETEISSLGANITAANSAIVSTAANVVAANSAIAQVSAGVTAANNAIAQVNANVAAANATIASLATTNNPTFTGTVITDNLTASGNVLAGNLNSNGTVRAVSISGNLLTASQPNVNFVGNLITANVIGDFRVGGNITTVGTSTAATYNTAGNVNAGTVGATYLYGTISTPTQPGITQVGTLTLLNVGGTINTQNVVASGYVSAPLFIGTLGQGNQPGVTQTGTLANLSVTDYVNVGNVVYITPGNATITATLLKGSLVNASQPNVTSLGTLVSLTVAGNVLAGNLNTTGTLSAPSISGPIITAAQPYITSLGTLSGLTVAANIATANLSVTATAQQYDTFVSNTFTVTGSTTLGNATVGNLVLGPQASVLGATANLTVANAMVTAAYLQTANINSQTDSSSTNTGALVVKGGVGINKVLNVGGIANFNSNVNLFGNLFVTPAGVAPALTLGGSMLMTGIPIIDSTQASFAVMPSPTSVDIGNSATTVNIGAISGFGNTTIRNSLYVAGNIFANIGNQSGNVTINSNLSIQNSVFAFANIWTYSNLTVYGNTLVANLQSQGNVGLQSALFVTGSYNGTKHNTGAVQITNGGLGVAGNINTTGTQANIYSFTRTIGANTGALVVQGGASVGGNLFIGGDATITGNVNFQAFLAASINGTPIGNATPASGQFTTIGFTSVRPQRRATINIDFANYKRLDRQKFTYTRTNQATFYDQRGNLITAGNNVPRFAHDPATFLPLGILLEESRQNLYVQSALFANTSVWLASNTSVSAVTSATTSPTGNFDAYLVQEDNSNSLHQLYPYNATYLPVLTTSVTYTASVFAKAAGRNQLALQFSGEGNMPIFDLQLGVVTYEPAGTVATMQTLANGWYRCSTTVTKVNNTSGNVSIMLVNGAATTYTGNGVSGVYAYGMQLEEGTFPTSYIPNTFAANTRGQDNLSINSTAFTPHFDQYRSTVLVDAQLAYRPTAKLQQFQRSTLVSFNDGTESNRVSIVTESLNSPINRGANIVVYTNGVFQNNVIIATANLTATGGSKIAAYFTKNLIQAAIDGNVIPQNVGGNVPVITTMTIGSGPGTPALNGTVRKVQYYPELSTAGELTYLTLQ